MSPLLSVIRGAAITDTLCKLDLRSVARMRSRFDEVDVSVGFRSERRLSLRILEPAYCLGTEVQPVRHTENIGNELLAYPSQTDYTKCAGMK